MAAKSKIEWTDATWNPTRGCTRVSPGCGGANHQGGCYAEKIAARFSGPGQPFEGFAKRTAHGGAWTGKMALVDDMLTLPLRWRKPRRIFVNSMSDLFHENLADEVIDKVFAVMALCPQHAFQVLTKRAGRMRAYFEERWQGTPAQRFKVGNTVIDMPAGAETGREHQVEIAVEAVLEDFPKMTDTDNDALWTEAGSLKIRQYRWPLPNAWLGVSVEDQERADERIPDLLATPAAVRFLSCEPLLGPINLPAFECPDCFRGRTRDSSHFFDEPCPACNGTGVERPWLDWVIAGGESGPSARPMHPDWVRSLRDQCGVAGVPFFFKQWGEWAPDPRQQHTKGDYVSRVPGATPQTCADATWMARVGKKAAGAMLDGVEHRAMPA